ncbi:sugar transport protein 8-like [Impatiens glandulifera]|uniref:sugar transport protein 8-like n=1 Tax=Impatiens glandulifera TaxID=253017 RepID=UPI001FB18501|nr:sugar transport protein 8-like [Impatiens glandulifera]
MTENGQSTTFKSKITAYVVGCWLLAAFGGMMFGYDIGISGGVTSMDDFLEKFFPKVYERKQHAVENNYCKYDNQLLQLFTSSLYLAALVATFFASKACSLLGRKYTILIASCFFIISAILSSVGNNIELLIVARILFGIGVGFGNESVPLFLTEVAPIQHRGAVNILFQLFVTIGILIANLVNYFTSTVHPNGWRWSLGLAGVPAVILFLGSLVITDTPSSLVERGKDEKGKKVLKKIRGVENVDEEFEQIREGCERAKLVKQPFKKLMERSSVPPMVIGISIQVFQQLTGINAIMFYAPVLFQTIGFKSDASLLSSVVTGSVNVLSTLVSIYAVDKVGRRKLLLQACIQMFICQMAVGLILAITLKNTGTISKELGIVVLLMVCLYVAAFAWSWGPLGWLIPSETFPLETRTAGFAFAVSTNMLMTFVVAQAFLSMLCKMRAFIFIFFSGWILVMGLFVILFVPETKGVALEDINERVWSVHPIWKKFVSERRNLPMV